MTPRQHRISTAITRDGKRRLYCMTCGECVAVAERRRPAKRQALRHRTGTQATLLVLAS
jgi:hypothetical protein